MKFLLFALFFAIGGQITSASSLETVPLKRQFVYLQEAAGQTDTNVRYWVNNSNSFLRLTANSIVVQDSMAGLASIRFTDGMPASVPAERISLRINSFAGDASGWRSDVGGWRAVEYTNAYQGIDLTMRPQTGLEVESLGNSIRLSLKISVRTGASAGDFALDTGTNAPGATQIDPVSGSAAIVVPWYTFGFEAPIGWQDIAGRRVPVLVRFVKKANGALSLAPEAYDRTHTLFIETAMRDNVLELGVAETLATDAQGNLFLAGTVASPLTCVITTGGTRIACTDAWVAGFRANGEAFFLTTLEGSVEDSLQDLRWRAPGELVVLGNTASPDFPVTTNAYQKQNAGPLGPVPRTRLGPAGDLFLARIDATSGDLLYSSYYGGPVVGETGLLSVGGDQVLVLVNNASSKLVMSTDAWRPTANCLTPTDCPNFAVLLFNSPMTQLERATFLPVATYKAVERHLDGTVYLAGQAYELGTNSARGTPGALQPDRQGRTDAYLLRLRGDLTGALFATFYGSPNGDDAQALQVDATGNAWLLGSNISAEGAVQNFLVQISADGSRLISRKEIGAPWSSFDALARNVDGRIFVGGNSSAGLLETSADAPQKSNCGSNPGGSGFLNVLRADGSLGLKTYLPGNGVAKRGFALNPAGQLLILERRVLSLFRIDLNAEPKPTLACVTGAASRRVGTGISPGQIITLVGAAMGPQLGRAAELTSDRRFPLNLAGVSVRVNGVLAPLLYAQASQINAIVPYEGIAPRTFAKVEVEYEGRVISSSVPTIHTSVELFTSDFSGDGRAVALNEDGSINSPENPALRGSIVVLFGTGIGTTQPGSITGALAPLSGPTALAKPIGTVQVLVGGRLTEVLYAGVAPGLVNGAAQFNLRIPIDLPPSFGATVNFDIRINGSLPANAPQIAIR